MQLCTSHLQSKCHGQKLISEEFHRITSKDLLGTFGAAFDKHVPCLLKLYRARKGAFGQKMEDLLEKLDEKVSEVPQSKSMQKLRGKWPEPGPPKPFPPV
ncbi:hypothetical protein JOQ06_029747 [Pogonophryne albipinna]|uniref:Uncharacterized protein n=1 Tax=Pogonophryne albipinna TaxID=1090488 RepID=A0AAD6FF81_9TELE|nr:hypothetical protein JOQ06_029747 [Pogonophryne albipinna]